MGRRHGVSWRVKRRALGQMGRGMTSAEVGAEAGVSGSAVRMWVAEHGVMSSYEPRARDGELSLDERIEIQVGLRRGDKPPAIARGLGRHRSTVWREVRRNVGEDGDVADYRAAAAQERAEQEARRPRQWWWQEQPELWAVVCERLIDHLWSPEQISAWLRIGQSL